MSEQLTLGAINASDRQVLTYKELKTWYKLTSHNNLAIMLAEGLIYNIKDKDWDINHYFPHYTLLFPQKISLEEIANHMAEKNQEGTKRKPNYIDCFLQVDFVAYQGEIYLYRNGVWAQESFNEKTNFTDVEAVLLPEYLPSAWIREINYLEQDDNKTRIQDLAIETRNVPETYFNSQLKKMPHRYYNTKNKLDLNDLVRAWKDKTFSEPSIDGNRLNWAKSVGAIIASLYEFSRRYPLANKLLASLEGGQALVFSEGERILSHLSTWIRGELEIDKLDTSSRLFWKLAENLLPSAEVHLGNSVIATFSQEIEESTDKQHFYKQKVIEALTGINEKLASNSLSSYLEENKSSRTVNSLILLLAKDGLEKLFGLEDEHACLRETDILQAVVLRAIFTGFNKLSGKLKSQQAIINPVSCFMAGVIYPSLALETIHLPKTLYSLFNTPNWNKAQEKCALGLVKKFKWTSCIKAQIDIVGLAKLQGTLQDGKLWVEAYIDPEKYIQTKIDIPAFLVQLAHAEIDEKTEARVREMLGG
ncbi:hypothetical protein A4G20_04760 [Pasteurellaceae bacterium RH1A]|nr:hypothetical protein A4G20_04760 [Pasteurellaceae bacterium RH1A]